MKRNNLFRKTAACTLAIVMMAAGTLTGCSKPAKWNAENMYKDELEVTYVQSDKEGMETDGFHTFFCA